MALDKLVDSTQLDSDLTSVANAIRAKSGGSSQLAFPAGFVSEIGNIPSGGGTAPYVVVTGTVTPVSDTDTITISNTGITTPLSFEGHVDNYSDYLTSAYDGATLSFCYQYPKAIVPCGNNYQGNLNIVNMGASSHVDYYTTALRPSLSSGDFTIWIPNKKFAAGVPIHYIIVGV